MSNTSKGRGTKGSKFWMQIVVEEENLQKELNEKIGEDLRWISPLAGDNEEFEEYELGCKVMRNELGISEADSKVIFSFWPRRQPQWDGLAISADGKTLYLVEAKAHLDELATKMSASNEESIRQITKSMKTVHDAYYEKGDFDAWLNEYYQLGNRLTFLKYLQNVRFEKIEKVRLILLNFVDDFTYKPTGIQEWQAHYEHVFRTMIDSKTAPEDVQVVYFEVGGRGMAINPITGRLLCAEDR